MQTAADSDSDEVSSREARQQSVTPVIDDASLSQLVLMHCFYSKLSTVSSSISFLILCSFAMFLLHGQMVGVMFVTFNQCLLDMIQIGLSCAVLWNGTIGSTFSVLCGKKQMIYIAVLCNLKITAEPLYNTPLFIGPYAAANNTALFSMKALARYQVILLGEQRHIRCEQLAQGCCPNNAAVGVEPVTS